MKSWILLVSVLLVSGNAVQESAPPELSAGPMVGVVERDGVRIWCRASSADQVVEAILLDAEGAEVARVAMIVGIAPMPTEGSAIPMTMES